MSCIVSTSLATLVMEFLACHAWSKNAVSPTVLYAGICCHHGPRRRSLCARAFCSAGGFCSAAAPATIGRRDVDMVLGYLPFPRGSPRGKRARAGSGLITLGRAPQFIRYLFRQLARLEHARGCAEPKHPTSNTIEHLDTLGNRQRRPNSTICRDSELLRGMYAPGPHALCDTRVQLDKQLEPST